MWRSERTQGAVSAADRPGDSFALCNRLQVVLDGQDGTGARLSARYTAITCPSGGAGPAATIHLIVGYRTKMGASYLQFILVVSQLAS